MRRLIWMALTVALLAGCSSFRQQPESTDLTENWAFSGKMAVRNADEASSFNVNWQQKAEAFEIELSGPLGQGAVDIQGQPGRVTLTRGDETVVAGNLSQLAYEVTNLNLPLDYLQFWVRAQPFPTQEAKVERDRETGQVERIVQSGWEVTFPAYYGEGEAALPRRIDFQRDNSSGRLVIRNWMVEG